jgi:UrcA family protein
MLRNVICTISAALAFAPIAAAAAPPPDEAVAYVRISDLDLNRKEGARVALMRIRDAARRVCGNESDVRLLGRQALYRACVREAVDRTVASAHSPALTLLAQGPAAPTRIAAAR